MVILVVITGFNRYKELLGAEQLFPVDTLQEYNWCSQTIYAVETVL